MKNLQMPFSRKWVTCPHCGKRLAMVDKNSNIEKVYIKCTRCKNEIEIKNKINN
ncbi:MJ0042-type zinc finger domain-containing protein [Helcococcus kunzii]|uniref:MJ0042-type zinc finger domain-containing protein n=1 Tax=Helcococcus kunzii TaxID=40091 RepID=UPI0024AE8719|nr:MJ0042-type zinc finger domain-containing protein [Helcococcus kunzii]